MKIKVETFFDPLTFTLTYIVFDKVSRDAIVIDPVWDYDQASSSISNESLDRICSYVENENLNLRYILETHIHADHLSSAAQLKKRYPNAQTAVAEKVIAVQEIFKNIYNLKDFPCDGSQFDHLFQDEEILVAGSLTIRVMATPGHTPSCLSYVIGDNVFTGDALFMPDSGTGRCDFPGGDPVALYESIQKIYALDGNFNIYTGHDYQPDGRDLKYTTTIEKSKMENIHIKVDTKKDDFFLIRTARDKTLGAPRLLIPSIQVNMAGGVLPKEESNGVSYLKIPVKVLCHGYQSKNRGV